MKISFDIKYRPEIESGKYRVETREGKSVRIICWDGNTKDCPIVGFIASHDYVRYWHNTGIIKEDYGCNNKDDIFIITDEVNLTEFELALLNIVNSFEGKKMHPEGAKAFSKELLSIAMKDVPTNCKIITKTFTEEKQLLIIDFCARLPYNVVIRCTDNDTDYKCFLTTDILNELLHNIEYYDYKPYLRPMSSMTEEEFENLKSYSGLIYSQLDLTSFQNGTYKCLDFYLNEIPSDVVILVFDWLNTHHFDYRGLIEKGLALKAPEGMYKFD